MGPFSYTTKDAVFKYSYVAGPRWMPCVYFDAACAKHGLARVGTVTVEEQPSLLDDKVDVIVYANVKRI